MKHVLFSLTALFAVTLLSVSAHAETNIGIVNIQKIMAEASSAKSVRDQLQSKQKAFQAELDSKEKALLSEDQALSKQQANMEKAAFEQKVKDFRAKAAAAQREIQGKKASLDKAFAGALEQIQTNVVNITAEVAREKKLNIVVSSAQVLYGDTSLDVTNDVLARLNKKLPAVTLKF
ncbi:MAG: OmpH family outer membrane protein [Rickettsiales bacterium]